MAWSSDFDHVDRHDTAAEGFYEDRLKLIEAYDRAGIYGYHCAEHIRRRSHGAPRQVSISPPSRSAPSAEFRALVYTLRSITRSGWPKKSACSTR